MGRLVLAAAARPPPGEVGALLRSEGIYSSSLSSWRRARDLGELNALSPKRRGPKAAIPDARRRLWRWWSSNPVHATWDRTVVGTARLTATRPTLTASSVERADALKATVSGALAELATWKKRAQHPLPALRAWLDEPLPALGGQGLHGANPAQLRRELGLDELGQPLAEPDVWRTRVLRFKRAIWLSLLLE